MFSALSLYDVVGKYTFRLFVTDEPGYFDQVHAVEYPYDIVVNVSPNAVVPTPTPTPSPSPIPSVPVTTLD